MKEFLTNIEREVLKKQHRQEKNRRVADRIKAILLSDKGWTYRQIAEALLIDEQTIGCHVDEYKKNQKLTLSSGGSMGKLSWMYSKSWFINFQVLAYNLNPYISKNRTKGISAGNKS